MYNKLDSVYYKKEEQVKSRKQVKAESGEDRSGEIRDDYDQIYSMYICSQRTIKILCYKRIKSSNNNC